MQNEPTNYEQAMAELENIVAKVENNEMNIDDLTAQLSRAQQLIKFCRGRLLKTEEEVKKILSSDTDADTDVQENPAANVNAGL